MNAFDGSSPCGRVLLAGPASLPNTCPARNATPFLTSYHFPYGCGVLELSALSRSRRSRVVRSLTVAAFSRCPLSHGRGALALSAPSRARRSRVVRSLTVAAFSRCPLPHGRGSERTRSCDAVRRGTRTSLLESALATIGLRQPLRFCIALLERHDIQHGFLLAEPKAQEIDDKLPASRRMNV